MASIVPGFEYDVFISYRSKDNKYDGWVTNFVINLKKELEATFKEEISVYFDLNPGDGLLETDDIDASLRNKLKCLVFIPVISQTYCDKESYAWKYEFSAFNRVASGDQFGLTVRLANGNVANRILPVRIHDLDPDDIRLLQDELGGPVRSIDFIYRATGVNRPLRADEDHPGDNQNKTYYRDQINKVANSIKGIISALKNPVQDAPYRNVTAGTKHDVRERLKLRIIIGSVILLVLFLLGYFNFSKIPEPTGQQDKTIAVLPFRNLSRDTTQAYFCDGFTEEILNNLQKISSFTVRSRISAEQYRNSQKSIIAIGNELKVNYIITGSVGFEEDDLKIWIQLIDSNNDKPIWSNDYTREMKQIFSLQSEIAKEIASELKIILTPEEIVKIEKEPTGNIEAHNYYLQGNYYYWKDFSSGDNNTAIELYEKAISLDPEFALAYAGIANCLLDQYFYKDRSQEILQKSKEVIDKAFEIDPGLPEARLALGNYYYQGYMDYEKALEQFEKILKDQPRNSLAMYSSAAVHRRAGNWEAARSAFEKAFELDPARPEIAEDTGETHDLLRNYSKAEEFYNLSITLKPEWIVPYYFLSQMYLRWEGDPVKAYGILDNAVLNNKKFITDSLFIMAKVEIQINNGDYAEALKEISSIKTGVFSSQFFYKPVYLYKATIYGLMNEPGSENACYDSARIFLENKLKTMPEDPRILSSLGIAYAGLGLVKKATDAGEKAVNLLPVKREAYKGIFLLQDLARIYLMTGNYDDAIRELKYLLSIPGFLSVKILETDPVWAALRDHPEFKKLLYNKSSFTSLNINGGAKAQ
jgi:TolB-like protein/cytochrome c-type biogenesis protein CcmH/NrfG